MVSKFIWYELMTEDVAAAEEFYRSVVGWNTEPFGGSHMEYIVVKAGERGIGGIMKMPEPVKAMGTPPCWLGYIHTTDVERTTAALKAAGGSVHHPPHDIPDVGRFSVVADPQGAVFMLLQPLGEEQPAISPMTEGHIGWHELYAADGGDALNFYASQFGWTKTDEMDMGQMGKYLMFAAQDASDPIGGIMTRPHPDMPPNWQFYFNVGNIDEAVERVTQGGGEIFNGPMEVPGGAWIVQGNDPQGAMFSLVGSR